MRSGVPPQGEQQPAPGGMTALLFAARDGGSTPRSCWLEAGADVNAPDPNGITPLLMAITNNQIDVAQFLVEQGAESEARRLVGTHAAVGRGRDPQSRPPERRHGRTASIVMPRCG